MSRPVATYRDTRNLLHPLILMLNDFLRRPNSPCPIPEMIYLCQMSETGTLPGCKFYPRAIITYMVKRYWEFTENLRFEPRLVRRFHYQYYEDGRLRVYEFSNKMKFHDDIIILQYMYVLRRIHRDFPPRIHLEMLMVSKYRIYDDIFCSNCKIPNMSWMYICENANCLTNDPRKITFGRIFASYLSVTLWMYNNLPSVVGVIRRVFPYGTFPGMIGSPYFSLILSRSIELDSKHLLAVNMAICAFCERSLPIMGIYARLLQYYMSFDVYTEDMRTDICIKLGIVMKRNGKYFLVRNLKKHSPYYVIAKDKIYNIRQNDVTLTGTLATINLLPA